PIGLGVSVDVVHGLTSQGLDTSSVLPFTDSDPGAASLSGGVGSVSLFNRPQHPNAAKAFVNWLLTQEGQALWADITKYNSRRTDVPAADPKGAVDPKMQLTELIRSTSDSFE